MSDNDRIVFPDEVEDAKAAAAEANDVNQGGDSNSVEDAPESDFTIEPRNMIHVPANCPPGTQMGADGVCRIVFN